MNGFACRHVPFLMYSRYKNTCHIVYRHLCAKIFDISTYTISQFSILFKVPLWFCKIYDRLYRISCVSCLRCCVLYQAHLVVVGLAIKSFRSRFPCAKNTIFPMWMIYLYDSMLDIHVISCLLFSYLQWYWMPPI